MLYLELFVMGGHALFHREIQPPRPDSESLRTFWVCRGLQMIRIIGSLILLVEHLRSMGIVLEKMLLTLSKHHAGCSRRLFYVQLASSTLSGEAVSVSGVSSQHDTQANVESFLCSVPGCCRLIAEVPASFTTHCPNLQIERFQSRFLSLA